MLTHKVYGRVRLLKNNDLNFKSTHPEIIKIALPNNDRPQLCYVYDINPTISKETLVEYGYEFRNL